MPLQGKVLCYLERKRKHISSGSTVRLKYLKKTKQTLSKPPTLLSTFCTKQGKMGALCTGLALKHLLPIPLIAPFTSLRFVVLSYMMDIKIAWYCLEHTRVKHNPWIRFLNATIGEKRLQHYMANKEFYFCIMCSTEFLQENQVFFFLLVIIFKISRR